MSGGITVKAENPENAWRQRGFHAGEKGRDSSPPADPSLAAVYRDGYRRGAERRSKLAP